jgi:hypothetical protein
MFCKKIAVIGENTWALIKGDWGRKRGTEGEMYMYWRKFR